jgi:hypothetical protein
MVLGDAGGDELRSDGAFAVSLADATSAWRDSIPSIMGAGIDVG